MSFIHDIGDIVAASGNGLLGVHPSWERVRAGDVLKILNGFPFKSEHFNKSHGHPLLRIRDILRGETETYYNGPEIEGYWVEHGDLVVGMDGDFNCRVWTGRRALLNQRACKLTPDDEFYSLAFLAYALPGYLRAINRQTSSLTVKHLSSRTIAELPLPLPPRKEQDRIVAKLDELFSRIEKGEENLKRVQALVKRYRQAVLKAAVTGELTRDWRERNAGKGETGAELLQRILAARRAAWEKAELAKMKAKGKKPSDRGWRRSYRDPDAPDTFDLPELPEGWRWVSVNQLAEVQTGATPKRGESKYYANGTVPWVTSAAVNDAIVTEPAELITTLAISETNAKVFPVGTLILAMYGEGKTRGKISQLGIAAATNQACAAMLVGHLDSAVARFIALFFLEQYEVVRRRSAGGVQPNLNLEIVRSTRLPLPPLAEIRLLVDRAEAMLSKLVKLEAELEEQIGRAQMLRQSTLRAAFSGKLVPQDPNDEPASILLERFATQRAQGTAKPKRPRARNARAELAQEALS